MWSCIGGDGRVDSVVVNCGTSRPLIMGLSVDAPGGSTISLAVRVGTLWTRDCSCSSMIV